MKPHEPGADAGRPAVLTTRAGGDDDDQDDHNHNNPRHHLRQQQQQQPHQQQHQQQLDHRTTRASSSCCSRRRRGRLFSLLDLRFADPKLEQLYHIYYAQVKRNLLPTAIQVVLLVNISQFITTCLSYYLLLASDNNNNDHDDGARRRPPISSPASSSELFTFPNTLVWPIVMQLIIFVIATPMLKLVTRELKPAGQSAANEQPFARHTKFKQNERQRPRRPRHRRRRAESSCGTTTDDEAGSNPSMHDNIELKSIRAPAATHRRHGDSSSAGGGGRQSATSALSAGLSLVIEPELGSGLSSRDSSDNSSSSSSSLSSSSDDDDDDDERATEQAATKSELDDKDADDNVDERTKFNKSPSNDKATTTKLRRQQGTETTTTNNERRRRSHRRRLSAQQRLPSGLSRYKLSLPYILWFCQLMQLASGLWPQQSFTAYSTLLLYSYAIYVILPMRLRSCIMLAVGLSIIEPLIDYLLWLNISAPFIHDNYYSPALASATRVASSEQDGYESRPPTTSDLMNRATTTDAVAAASRHNHSSLVNLHPSARDSSLLIPMTSQISKVSWRSLCVLIAGA
jgi:hypothetical protein